MPKGIKQIEYEIEDMLFKANYQGSTGRRRMARKIVEKVVELLELGKEDSVRNREWDDFHGFPEELKPIVQKLERGLGINHMARDENAIEVYRWIMQQKDLDKFITWATNEENARFVAKYRRNPGLIKTEWVLAVKDTIASPDMIGF